MSLLLPRSAVGLLLIGLSACASDVARHAKSDAGEPATGIDAGSSHPRPDGGPGGSDAAPPMGDAGDGDVASHDASTPPGEDDTDTWFIPKNVPLAARPPMGWNTWNKFKCSFNADDIKGMADAMVSSGMQAAGYQFINIDDCWADHRDDSGNIVPGSNFPDGIAKVVDYIHQKGLKAGIYTTVGATTCAGRTASLGHAAQDAKTYASWGIDYAKIDWCGVQGEPADSWREWQTALASAGRPIVYSICTAGRFDPWNWAYDVGNLWRTTDDINPNWNDSILSILDQNQPLAFLARPGAWNDPDMLEVGNGINTWDIQSEDQNRTHFSLWAMMAAPLIAGNDLRSMTDTVKSILTNAEVIAVDQDELGYQGYRVRKTDAGEVWMKPLSGDGVRAVALFNRGATELSMQVSWAEIGLAPGSASVRDLWQHQDLGAFDDAFSVSVKPQATVMLKVVGKPPALPQGHVFASDLTPTYATNYWGPVERDTSVGEQNLGDGKKLTIAGATFDKGLGVHAGSLIRYRLRGHCSKFTASVGIDDEVGGGTGSVRFEVWADGERLVQTDLLKTGTAAVQIEANLAGKQELKLLASHADDGFSFDHADWGNAALDCDP